MAIEDLDVTIDVQGYELDENQRAVVDLYEENVQTFIRKNHDYAGSFVNSAKIESILRHGEVREDELGRTIARQIFVRGFLDKLSRFYNLYMMENDAQVDESVVDTLLDLGNYSIMLASQLRRYEDGS